LAVTLFVDLRGEEFAANIETLNILPKTILHSLFPRGLSQSELNQHKVVVDDPYDPADGASIIWYESGFDPGLFRYVLESFGLTCRLVAGYHAIERPSGLLQAELLIIREELRYFVLPRTEKSEDLLSLKEKCGRHLLSQRTISPSLERYFSCLLRLPKLETGDEWGFRALQPSSSR
ncbi:hypothetical protein B0H13DRAFT_2534596, partial [Mycena leptocephala]